MTKNNGLIKNLKDRYDLKRQERADREEKMRPFQERVQAIFDSPLRVTTDFWCNTCKKDCTGAGYRQVCTIDAKHPTGWFTGYCPKGHKLIRRITDKITDPYYEMSFMIRRQRYDLKDEFLTPDDPRFKVLYPRQWKELMEKKDA